MHNTPIVPSMWPNVLGRGLAICVAWFLAHSTVFAESTEKKVTKPTAVRAVGTKGVSPKQADAPAVRKPLVADKKKDTPVAKPKKQGIPATAVANKKAVDAKTAPSKPQPETKKSVGVAKKSSPTVPGVFAHAVLLNGGQNAQINFYSHVLYLRMMRQLMNELGIHDNDISIIAADGDDPKPDQAILLEKKRPEQWLFAYRPEERFFPRSPSLINTVIKGKSLHTATKKQINSLFKTLAQQTKGSKKPVFLFVTDHGTPDRKLKHHRNNRISLWQEDWSVNEFHKALRPFGRRKVVSVMSQCFSGSFMWSVFRKPGRFGIPLGDRCGFYATLPDRYAYGCFPETRLKKQVGHAYRFILAMRRAKTFDEAHREVLLTDMTPDVPHRSSDGYLFAMLREDAKAEGIAAHKMVDSILSKYKGRSYPGMKEDMALISGIAQRFGLIRPMDMETLRKQRKGLETRQKWWERVDHMWQDVYNTARSYHLAQIYKAKPELWKSVNGLMRRDPEFFRKLYQKHKELRQTPELIESPNKVGMVRPLLSAPRVAQKVSTLAQTPCQVPPPPADDRKTPPPPTQEPGHEGHNHPPGQHPPHPPHAPSQPPPPAVPPAVVPAPTSVPAVVETLSPVKTITTVRSEFLNYLQARPRLFQRLHMLYRKKQEMSSYVFLIKTQIAALKRIELLFYRMAGQLLLHHDKHPEFQAYRNGMQNLIACEQTPIRPDSYKAPALQLEDAMVGAKHPPLPSWFGISFRPVPEKERGTLPTGAVQVEAVYLNTPAKAAGMETGDIVVAVNREQLFEPFEIRERVMLAPPGKPTPMLVLRQGQLRSLAVALRRQTSPPPLKLPPLLGKFVPSLEPGRLLIGDLKQKIPYSSKKGTYLLYFWATWCGPCKMAFPQMRKWEKQFAPLGYRTITISNEKPQEILTWMRRGNNVQRMPFLNAYDLKMYELFREFRVQGTPTFVLVHNGQVKFVHIGFRYLDKFENALSVLLKPQAK